MSQLHLRFSETRNLNILLDHKRNRLLWDKRDKTATTITCNVVLKAVQTQSSLSGFRSIDFRIPIHIMSQTILFFASSRDDVFNINSGEMILKGNVNFICGEEWPFFFFYACVFVFLVVCSPIGMAGFKCASWHSSDDGHLLFQCLISFLLKGQWQNQTLKRLFFKLKLAIAFDCAFRE